MNTMNTSHSGVRVSGTKRQNPILSLRSASNPNEAKSTAQVSDAKPQIDVNQMHKFNNTSV